MTSSFLEGLEFSVIFFGLGHFAIAYKYIYTAHKRKVLFASFVMLFSLFALYAFYTSVSVRVLFLIANALFALHHAYDSYKIFRSSFISFLWLFLGIISTLLSYISFFLFLIPQSIPTLFLSVMVLYHCYMWYEYYYRKFTGETLRNYSIDIIVIHVALVILLLASKRDVYAGLSILFSYKFFYLQTINHVLFSYYKKLTHITHRYGKTAVLYFK